MHVKNLQAGLILIAIAAAVVAPSQLMAMGDDDPLLGKFMVDRLEYQHTDGPGPLAVEIGAWLGRDLNKLWFKSDYERVHGDTEENEIQLLYSRAVTPFWDLQLGWRGDFRPEPKRHWLAFGAMGEAPYEIEMDAAVFAGESGRMGARLSAEYEYLFTQKWILSPEMEINFHSKDDAAVGVGSGLSDLELGLRLRYQISRQFAPYIGLNWQRKFGQTADYARDEDEATDDAQFVTGFRAWF